MLNAQRNDSSHDRPWSRAPRKSIACCLAGPARFVTLTKRLQEESIMKAIRVAVSAAGIAAMVAVVASGQVALVAADGDLKAETAADTKGNLHVPNAYRTTYEFLGTWAVAADHGQGSQELHVVYASPGTITAYRRGGHFPDNTVLVKEVHFATTGQMTTGTISQAVNPLPFSPLPGRRRGSVARLQRELQILSSAGASDGLDLR